jgi:hypothetical protein
MLAVAWAAGPTASDAAATAAITLNQTEFKAGDTLSVGLQIANPADRPPASLHIGVVMPDGNTALFVVQGGTTAPGTISWSACSYSTPVASAVGTNRSAGDARDAGRGSVLLALRIVVGVVPLPPGRVRVPLDIRTFLTIIGWVLHGIALTRSRAPGGIACA